MKIINRSLNFRILAAALAGIALVGFSAKADTYTFTNNDLNNDYSDLFNWSDPLNNNAVPNLTGGDTAIISSDGSAVTYTSGPDFVIDNHSTLQVTNGSWTQVGGGGWIQLEGNGNILVNGGTFNQGTAGNTPFNISNTGNTFTITSGAANFNSSLASTSAGMTYNFDGGVSTFAGEMDYNTNNNIFVAGGTLNLTLMTAVNNGNNGSFTISGGRINLSSNFGGSGGFYAANPSAAPNFTSGSTGSIDFETATLGSGLVAGYVTSGDFLYNGTTADLSDFTITSDGSGGTLLSAISAVPEPSTDLMLVMGISFLVFLTARRRSSNTVR